LLLLNLLFWLGLAKHISKTELTYTISKRNIAFGTTYFTLSFK
jgi:hypothetical protein